MLIELPKKFSNNADKLLLNDIVSHKLQLDELKVQVYTANIGNSQASHGCHPYPFWWPEREHYPRRVDEGNDNPYIFNKQREDAVQKLQRHTIPSTFYEII